MFSHMPAASNGSGLDIVRASTFEDIPFNIALSSSDEVDYGATAKIYKGQIQGDEPLVVAVKVFGHMLGKVQEQLLVRELRAARKVAMRHPLILAFLGTAFIGQHQAIVSLFMKNGNLLEYLKTNPEADKERLILQVGEAVDYLHTVEGLAHGDLKCSNVLISDFGEALLADFGLSTFLDETVTRTMTAIRSMNTVSFAAPELLLGASDPNAPVPSKSRESDVYAFGMLILEAVTGQMPFVGLNSFAVMLRVCSGQLPSRPKLNGFVAISTAWWDVCRSCWKFNPNDRPRMQLVLQRLTAAHLLPKREICLSDGVTVAAVAYMSCGKRVVSSSWKTIEILDITSSQSLTIDGNCSHPPVAAVCPNSREIASSARNYTIQRWDAVSGIPLGQSMRGHTNDIKCIAYSPDGMCIVSGSADDTIRLWNASTGEAIGQPLAGHTSWVRSVAFSPNGRRIVSASTDTTIRIWRCRSCELFAILTGHSDVVTCARYLPDGKFIVSCSWDCTICIWDAQTLQLVYAMHGHLDLVYAVAVSPCGKYVASGSRDKTIRIWDTETGSPIGDPLNGHKCLVCSVNFSPDGKSIVSSSFDRTIRIWELFE